MFSKKEIIPVVAVIIILASVVSFLKSVQGFVFALVSIFLVVTVNIIAKKISAFYLDSEIEMKIWEVQRFGFKPWMHSKKPIMVGIFLPIILGLFSLGRLTWFAPLIFDVKPKVYRAARRYGLYSFSEMTEDHIGLIAAAGIVANIVLGILGYLIGFQEFAKLNLYFAFFNILPISDLDGNKIFFGNLIMWVFLATLVSIGAAYAILAL
ncbi:MAG: hypothetical protein ABIH49_01560 [archaeon]